MQGWERAINTLSVRSTPAAYNTNQKNERRDRENSREKKGTSSYDNKKALALLLKPASPKIVPQRYRQGIKRQFYF